MSGGNQALKSAAPLEEIVEPVQEGLLEIKKKIRNLEKKKTKLDTLRDDVKKSGKPLNEDQAVSRKETFPSRPCNAFIRSID